MESLTDDECAPAQHEALCSDPRGTQAGHDLIHLSSSSSPDSWREPINMNENNLLLNIVILYVNTTKFQTTKIRECK